MSVFRVSLADVDQLVAERRSRDTHPNRHVGAAVEPARQARGIHRHEFDERAVQIGDRAGRVEGAPRGIRVAVEDELQQDPHAPSLAPPAL